jgi:hypothetical protein
MKKIIKYSFGIFLLLGSQWAGAQSVILEELSPQTIRTRKDELRIKRMEAESARAEMLKEAARLDIPVSVINEDGTYMELQAIEEGMPLYYTTTNTISAQTISTDKVHPGGGAGLSLTGNGETMGIWDGGGVLTTHEQLTGRVTPKEVSALSSHATHVAGTMIGSGYGDADAKGMAYQGQLISYDFSNDLIEMEAEALNGLLVSNHSYGPRRGWYQASPGVWQWYGDHRISTTEDYLFGFYDNRAKEWDELANNYPYYLIVKAAGNDRRSGPWPGTEHRYYDYTVNSWVYSTAERNVIGGVTGSDCIAQNGVAKNILTIGAVENIPGGYSGYLSVGLANFSGTGPTDDGRIKPDLVANGITVYSANSTSNSSYLLLRGTSMSTPSVSGSIGLLNQHQKNLYGGHVFRASTMKALLIHTADATGGYPGPNYKFGWGLMNTQKAAQLMSKDAADCINIKELLLTNGGRIELPIKKKGTEPLRVTIAWNDPAGTPPPASLNPTTPMLVNNLDLRVSSLSTTYMPYVLGGLANPLGAATIGDNNVDNAEQVFIDNNDDEIYRIVISHKGTLTGGSQIVSLIISGNDVIDDNLVLNSPTINYQTSYWVHNTITAQSGFNVTSSGIVEMAAGSKIDLNPGFRSDLGSNFQTYIHDKLRCVSGVFMRKGYESSDHTPGWVAGSSETESSIQVSPNPVSGLATFKYQLMDSGNETSVEIVNLLGEVIDKFELGNQSSGWHEHVYNAAHLPAGLYIYHLKSGQKIYSSKFIRN